MTIIPPHLIGDKNGEAFSCFIADFLSSPNNRYHSRDRELFLLLCNQCFVCPTLVVDCTSAGNHQRLSGAAA